MKEQHPSHIITTNPAGAEDTVTGRSAHMKDTLKELELLIRSRYNLIFLETDEEERAETLLRLLASRLDIPYFFWTRTKGLVRGDVESKGAVYHSNDPVKALMHVEASGFPALYHFVGLDGFRDDKTAAELLKNAAGRYSANHGAIIISGHSHDIPEGLRSVSAVFRLPAPGRNEYKELLGRVTRDMLSRMKVDININEQDTNRLLSNLTGLTLTEAEKIITKLIVEDGELSSADVRRVAEAKKVIVEREGVLEYYPAEENMSEIADLATLKSWLSKRKEIVVNPEKAREFGLTFPKGILLLGVPGCGKSLCAKAVAMEWGLPLLKMDPSSLYNKYVGESEKNFNRAMKTAEKMSPVVLWIDEIEKAFSSDAGTADGGLSTRIFGTFLSWLQDRKGDVFHRGHGERRKRPPAGIHEEGAVRRDILRRPSGRGNPEIDILDSPSETREGSRPLRPRRTIGLSRRLQRLRNRAGNSLRALQRLFGKERAHDRDTSERNFGDSPSFRDNVGKNITAPRMGARQNSFRALTPAPEPPYFPFRANENITIDMPFMRNAIPTSKPSMNLLVSGNPAHTMMPSMTEAAPLTRSHIQFGTGLS